MAENDKITGKLFEKWIFIFDVPKYRVIRDSFRVGQALKSPAFYVGGCQFKILFYPNGRNEAVHSSGEVSLFMRNESSKATETVYSLHILEQFQPYSRRPKNIGFYYDGRRGCREVLTLQPDYQTGNFFFVKKDIIEDPNNYYVVGDCLKIRAIVGVFIDHTVTHPIDSSDDRYIFFQLESESESESVSEFESEPEPGKRRRYFAEESVLVSQCPRLLPHNYRYDRDILISDIKDDVFEAVLWFIYNNKLHNYDREEICKSNPSEPDSYASRILAAADRFDMKHFRRQCESIISGKTEEHGLFYKIISNLEKLFGGADHLLELDSSKNNKNE